MIDTYRAVRQFERAIRYGGNNSYSRPSPQPDSLQRPGELIATVFVDPKLEQEESKDLTI